MNFELAQAALKKYFGYSSFRPLQADIIQQLYDGKDVLVLMPTGGGKSICYQIPALTLPGTSLVISPLIALMKDQVEGLKANGVAAAYINSSLDISQIRAIEDRLLAGEVKILYVSPEKLVSSGFQPLLRRLSINLIAVDEAHCISAWGHDFRPEYTQLQFLKQQFPNIPIIALTATADKLTRKDIVEQLHLNDARIFIASFDRPNISLSIRPGQKRAEQIMEFLKSRPRQSGIIYCLSRKSCEEVAEKLISRGFQAAYYHAQMSQSQRAKVQEDFINDRISIICATIAFGMGIDKSNVRFVIHYNLPRNLEGYYQEVGRAGRDGLPADALLFFSYGDVQTYRNMIDESEGSLEQKELRIAKLNRMYQFAEAPVCRRQTVLNYFGEPFEGPCNNCDVCLNPPRKFDGTLAAQKALSAILRTGEKAGMTMLVNILRGSRNQDLLEAGFHNIKTYAAGREYSFDEWIFLVGQMLHIGLIEIAYDDHSYLKVTESGKAVVYQNKNVRLALPPERETKEKTPAARPKSTSQQRREELFERLVALRRMVAQENGIPPYIVFNDATLEEMAERRPLTDADMLQINGVGERKLELYGDAFLDVIRKFTLEKAESGSQVTGSTFLVTWNMYKEGRSVEEIAKERQLNPATIFGHLASLYEKGENLDISEWISYDELDIIQGALSLFSEPYVLREISEHFNQQYSFEKIRWAIADFKRKKIKVN